MRREVQVPRFHDGPQQTVERGAALPVFGWVVVVVIFVVVIVFVVVFVVVVVGVFW